MSEELKDTVELDDAEYKAVLATVLDRGYAHEALNVELPDNLTGEWIGNDAVSIARAKTLGFKIDTEYAKKNPIHSSGDSKAVYGDTVFMVISKQRKAIIDEVRKETARRRLGDKVDGKLKNQGEDSQFKGAMAPLVSEGITAIDTPSQSHIVDGNQIASALSEGQS